jgi:hypothetical protein
MAKEGRAPCPPARWCAWRVLIVAPPSGNKISPTTRLGTSRGMGNQSITGVKEIPGPRSSAIAQQIPCNVETNTRWLQPAATKEVCRERGRASRRCKPATSISLRLARTELAMNRHYTHHQGAPKQITPFFCCIGLSSA